MPIALLILLQTAPVAEAPPPRVFGPSMPQVSKVTADCAPSDDDEIVVCGKTDPEQYRLRPPGPPPNGKPLPPMTAKLGNGTIDGRAVQKCVGGFCVPAVMATIKLPF